MRDAVYIEWLRQKAIDCRDLQEVIMTALRDELSKPIAKRQKEYLLFLDKEKSVYSFALTILDEALGKIRHE